jgi:hypothetical protein
MKKIFRAHPIILEAKIEGCVQRRDPNHGSQDMM